MSNSMSRKNCLSDDLIGYFESSLAHIRLSFLSKNRKSILLGAGVVSFLTTLLFLFGSLGFTYAQSQNESKAENQIMKYFNWGYASATIQLTT
jgi:hypothetical protein